MNIIPRMVAASMARKFSPGLLAMALFLACVPAGSGDGRKANAPRPEAVRNQNAAGTAPAAAEKTAEQVFKNIQVLKGVPADQLIPAMRFITFSLGVECNFCHVEGHFDKDDKKPKVIARQMMRMMFAINTDNFDGQRRVTCYSCHRGAEKPIAIPLVGPQIAVSAGSEALPSPSGETNGEGGATGAGEGPKLPANLPSAGQLIDRYIKALGGREALEKITSRVEKGTSDFRGKSIPVEIFTAGGKLSVVRDLPGGEMATTFDGQQGWSSAHGRPPREMHQADLDAARMDADLQFPLHIERLFPELRVGSPEKIGDRQAYLVSGIREGQPPVKMYFDQESGLLVRMVRYADSPLGLDPTQIDYADYRAVHGVQVPFLVTTAEPGSTSAVQIEVVQQNIPVSAAKFAKPPEIHPPEPPQGPPGPATAPK